MRLNKYHFQVLAVEAILVLLAGCLILAVAWIKTRTRSAQAASFLADLTKIEVGKSTFDQAKSLASKHGGIPWWVNDRSMQCTYEACTFRFLFENKPLTSTYLVPYTALVGDLFIKDGTIIGRSISYSRLAKLPRYYDVSEFVPPPAGSQEAMVHERRIGLSRLRIDPGGIPTVVLIVLEPNGNPDQKRRAYKVNLTCLTKLFGCDGGAIFPDDISLQGELSQTHSISW